MLATALQIAAAFNLVCTGSYVTHGDEATRRPFSQTFRIDLEKKQWCMGDCQETRDIYLLAPRTITLQLYAEGDDYGVTVLNRESGTMTNRSSQKGVASAGEATCERQPFTGFPALKF